MNIVQKFLCQTCGLISKKDTLVVDADYLKYPTEACKKCYEANDMVIRDIFEGYDSCYTMEDK